MVDKNSLDRVQILRNAYIDSIQALRVKLAPGSKLYPEVNTYADLPDATTVSGYVYLVLQNTYTLLIFNTKPAGLYKSNGTSWDFIGALPAIVADNNFKIYDSDDFTRQIAFNAGNISTLNTRTITMANRDIDLDYLGQDVKTTASPEFADVQITTLASDTLLGNTAKSVLDFLNKSWSYLKNIFVITKDPTGFVAPVNLVVTYDSSTRKVTLTGTVEAYWQGKRITALTSGWVSDAHSATNGVYFLYYDGTNFNWGTNFPEFSTLQIAIASYRATTPFCSRECHSFMPWESHKNAHYNIGTYRTSGGDISNLVLASTTADNRRPIISACYISDEDCPTVNAALTSKKYSQRYIVNAADITYVLQANDIVPLSGANPYYNSFTSPNYGQTLMPNDSVMTVWLYEVPVTADAASQEIRHIFVQGQSITVAANASAAALVAARTTEKLKNPSDVYLGVPAVVASEYVCIHKFIIQYTSRNWSISDSIQVTGSRNSQNNSAAGNFLTSVSINATNLSGNGTPVSPLNTIQDIATTSSPTFTGLTVDQMNITAPDDTTVEFDSADDGWVMNFNSYSTTILSLERGLARINGILYANSTFYQTGGYAYLGNYNAGASAAPRTGADVAIAWNRSNGGRDISFYNTDIANSGIHESFRFVQMLSASTYKDILYLNGSGNVGVGIASPVSLLDVSGSFGKKVTAASTGLTLDVTHSIVNCTGTFTVTLPQASTCTGRIYTINNISTGVITIDAYSTELIDGVQTKTIPTQWSSYTIQSNGTSWKIM